MGIISRGTAPDRKRTGATVIAAGTKLVGDLTLSDSLHVDGQIEGKINSEGEVSVGESGRINGEVHAETVMISGHLDGEIDAQRLEIVATGKVDGSVCVSQLVIEPGASFNGTSKTRESQSPRQLGHDNESNDNSEKDTVVVESSG